MGIGVGHACSAARTGGRTVGRDRRDLRSGGALEGPAYCGDCAAGLPQRYDQDLAPHRSL